MTDKIYITFGTKVGLSDGEDDIEILGERVEGRAVSNQTNLKNLRFTSKAFSSMLATFAERVEQTGRYPKALVNHNWEMIPVGQIRQLKRGRGGVDYVADINPDHASGIVTALRRGDIDSASVGGYSTDVRCSICKSQIYSLDCDHFLGLEFDGEIAEGLVHEFSLDELSFTPFPADERASVDKIGLSIYQSINDEKRKIREQTGETLINSQEDKPIDSDITMPEQEIIVPPTDNTGAQPVESSSNASSDEVDVLRQTVGLLQSELRAANEARVEFTDYMTQQKTAAKQVLVDKIIALSSTYSKDQLMGLPEETIHTVLQSLEGAKVEATSEDGDNGRGLVMEQSGFRGMSALNPSLNLTKDELKHAVRVEFGFTEILQEKTGSPHPPEHIVQRVQDWQTFGFGKKRPIEHTIEQYRLEQQRKKGEA